MILLHTILFWLTVVSVIFVYAAPHLFPYFRDGVQGTRRMFIVTVFLFIVSVANLVVLFSLPATPPATPTTQLEDCQ
jgi:hypothetical protein